MTFSARFASTVKIAFRSGDWGPEEFDVPVGTVLAKYIVEKKMPNLKMSCGGDMICGRCHVHLTDDLFAKTIEAFPISEDEEDTLDDNDRTPNSRLSCQLKVTPEFDGQEIIIPVE